MKRLLKPTGQILTTAVFTSTAVDAALPQAANPIPLDSSSPETTPTSRQQTIEATDVADSGETVAPPESGSAHEASHHGLPTPAPLSNAYANIQSPLPAEFFADLERSRDAVSATTSEADKAIATTTTVSARDAIATSEELPPLALPSNTTVLSQAAAAPSHQEPIEADPSEDLIAEIEVSLIGDGAGNLDHDPTLDSASLNSTVIDNLSVSKISQPSGSASNPDSMDHSTHSVESSVDDSVNIGNLTTSGDVNASTVNQPLPEQLLPKQPLPEQSLPNSFVIEQAPIESSEIQPLEPLPDPLELSPDPQIDSSLVDSSLRELSSDEQSIVQPTEDPAGQTLNDNTSAEETITDAQTTHESAHKNPHEGQDENLQQTRNWLDQQLALIVDQSRQRQSTEHRQRLIEFARQSLVMGNIEEARQIAQNPTLNEEERNALEVAIGETSSQDFIPLIPLDEAHNNLASGLNGIIGIQPTSPSLDSLPTLPTTPLTSPNPIQSRAIIASLSERLPSLPLSSRGLHQWPLSDSLAPGSSLTAEELKRCLVGHGEISIKSLDSIVDGASPRIAATSSKTTSNSMRSSAQAVPLEPMVYIGTGQQPPSSLKPSDTFPVGGDFLAGVGQQPPSILPEASWSGAPVLSGEPVPLKWTRSRLNRELEALEAEYGPVNANSSGPKTLSPDCHDALLQQQQASLVQPQNSIGGPTVANLTGYDWLSQFAIARSPSSGGNFPKRQPTQMILPLPQQVPITSGFGWRTHPIYGNRRFHFGLDYGAPSGTPILASISGRIETTGSLNGYGLTVILENDDLNLRNLYAHMSGIAVEEGTWVEQGTVIGWVGSTGNSTGPHLHFEVHKQTNDGWVAVDPLQAAAELLQLARR